MKRLSLFFLFLCASKVFACLQGPDASLIQQTLNEGKDAVLCPNNVFTVTDPIVFPKDDLSIYTEGYPKDESRAILRITGERLVGSNRIITALNALGKSRIKIKNIQIDGGRQEWDKQPYRLQGGVAGLIEFGGAGSVDGEISHIRAFNTRGWTTVHIVEGAKRTKVLRNHLGPAGHLLSEVWADGISVAAEESEIIGNVIEDPTDGGIVVFGAPRSKIIGNIIRSKTRPVLGGINMVDYTPWNGSFEGTIVSRNSIVAQSDQVRIGIAMGPPIWNCDGDLWWASLRLRGATVTDNLFTGNRMGYGIAVDNVDNWTISKNVSHARHSGTPQNRCKGINEKPATSPFIQMHTLPSRFDDFFVVRFAGMRSLHNLADTGPRSFRNDSELVSQNIPETMEIGKTYPIQIKFRNTGTQTWNPASGYRIGMLNPQDNNTWGVGRVELPSSVLPNETTTLEFNVTAPSTPGQYHLQCGTLQEGVEWFGDVSNNVVIDVVAPPPAPKPVIESVKSLTSLPIKGTYADLEVKAVHENGLQNELTYHWQASTQNPASTQFSLNASTNAYQTRVQFVSTGTYAFTVTVQNIDGKKASADISVPVVSALNQLEIKPSSATVIFNQVILFESFGYDQFKQPFNIKPQWEVNPTAGVIDEGLFTTGNSTGTYSITVKVEDTIASADVTILSNLLSPAPPRQSTYADFYPVLELKETIPSTAVLVTYPSKPEYKVKTYDWVFYPLKTLVKRIGGETSWQGTRLGIVRANTSQDGRLELSTLSIQANRTYGLSVTATTKDNKRSRTAYQIIHISDDRQLQIQPPTPPVVRIK